LDDEEADFLDAVDQARMDEERRKRLEEAQELLEFRQAATAIRDKVMEEHIRNEIFTVSSEKPKLKPKNDSPSIGTKRVSQSQLLAGVVRKRSHPSETEQKVQGSSTDSSEKASNSSTNINKEDVGSKAKVTKLGK